MGIANVEDEGGLLDTISYDQLRRWSEFYAYEPWGEGRIELMLAQVCALIYSANRGKGRQMRVADFLPRYGHQQRQSRRDMKAQVVGYMMALRSVGRG